MPLLLRHLSTNWEWQKGGSRANGGQLTIQNRQRFFDQQVFTGYALNLDIRGSDCYEFEAHIGTSKKLQGYLLQSEW